MGFAGVPHTVRAWASVLPLSGTPLGRLTNQHSHWRAVGALFGSPGHFFLMKALALDTAPALAPYTYVQIIFAMLGGWFMWAHTPDRWAVGGMLVIGLSGFASGLLPAHRGTEAAGAA